MGERVAALDAGTNTLRLYIAEVEEPASGRPVLRELERELRFVGLGHGVDATGLLNEASIARAWAAIEEYLQLLRRHRCSRARFVATSASRDAANRDEFFDGVRDRLGIQPELISGDEEAGLSFAGAVSGARLDGDPVLVMDSGGGSTELVRGDSSGRVEQAQSIEMGSRRIRERYLIGDPPSAAQVAAAREEMNRQLDRCSVDLTGIRTFIGVAGTATSMGAVNLGLTEYDRNRVHGSLMSPLEVVHLADRLLVMTVAEVAALGPVAPERATVLGAGSLVIAEVTRRVGVDLQVSEADILDGIAWSIVGAGKGQPLPG
ncbi:MAG: exopolyphosphatase [Brooklawnia sp.]|uniref:Ppx/GppA phosphatase family protein n=1 Tax=Brooklawnia sp. TaxID=2699740 RepID=UPI003C74B1DB